LNEDWWVFVSSKIVFKNANVNRFSYSHASQISAYFIPKNRDIQSCNVDTDTIAIHDITEYYNISYRIRKSKDANGVTSDRIL